MKIVGKRKPSKDLKAIDNLLQLVLDLRRGKPFIPKGIHRFHSFEEAEKWSLKMKTRKNLGPQR